jgi:hypothetical protein
MRSLILAILLLPATLHAQQLGVPLSSLPGVERGVPATVGGAAAGGVQGVTLSSGKLNRLMMAPANTGGAGGAQGEQIERAFFGDRPAPDGSAGFAMTDGTARVLTGAPPAQAPDRGVAASGTGVQLPTARQLMPQNLVPGYQSMRGGAVSPTGVGNVFTGSGVPRPGAAP